MNVASILSILAAAVWMGFFGVLILVIVRASRNRPIRRGGFLILGALVLAVVLSTISSGLVFISPQERGVVVSVISPKGYREMPLDPGLRFVVPFAENVVLYPVTKQTYTMSIAPSEGEIQGDDSIEARTSDGQRVLVDASVIFKIDPTKVVDVHLNWGNRYTNDLVRAVSRGVIRDAVSQYRIEEVYSSKRAELVKRMVDALVIKFSDNGLILEEFVLRNISFSDEYSASVEQKQIAEQQAQQAKFVVEQKRQEADQQREIAKGLADAAVTKSRGEAEARLIGAEAEAKSLELIAKVLKENPSLITYQYVSKLSPNIQVMLLPSNSPFLLNLPQTAGPLLQDLAPSNNQP